MGKVEAECERLVNDLETSRFQYDLLVRNSDEETASLKRQVKYAPSPSLFFFEAKAFLAMDLSAVQAVDTERRRWVHAFLRENDLPVVETGSYYVRSFQVEGEVPERLRPLSRDNVVRLCFKPPQV